MARPIRMLIGYELDQAKFVLGEFMKRMNEELSFLVRTFFYVLLGLILDVFSLTIEIVLMSIGLFCIVVFIRAAVTEVLARASNNVWTSNERWVIAAMFPRGVATAVMAFLPVSTGIPGTESFPIYALTVIALCVIGMTLVLTLHQCWHPASPGESVPEPSPS